MLKLFIGGSLSQIGEIEKIMNLYGAKHDAAVVRIPEIREETLFSAKLRAIDNIMWADTCIFVSKSDGTFGESTTFEMALCENLNKVYEKIEP